MELRVNEIFGPTIQGEGRSVGKRVLFLRLADCNLHCYLCDTDYTWRFDARHPHANNKVYDRKDEAHRMDVDEVVNKLYKQGEQLIIADMFCMPIYLRSLVVSGGEPLLQQKALVELCRNLKPGGWWKPNDWWIEVETNGTLIPRPELIELVDQFNCSPKLNSVFSGEPAKLRIREEALAVLAKLPKTHFKFVIADPSNLSEAIELVKRFNMKSVYLMPEGRTREEVAAKKPWLQDLCRQHGFVFSTRLHVELWGTKRGV